MDNVSCQLLTQALKDYKINKGDPDYRLYNLGLWTADLKESITLIKKPKTFS